MSQSPSPETQTPPSRLGRWLYWGLVGAIWATIGVAVLVFVYALDLPDTDELWKIGPKAELSLYAAEDELIARRGRRVGQPLQYKDFPPALVQAVTAIEDRRFFSHFGLDPKRDVQRVMDLVEAEGTSKLDIDGAFLRAASNGHVGVMEYLLEKGASDITGALACAAIHNQMRTVKYLAYHPNASVDRAALKVAAVAAGNNDAVDVEFFLLTKLRHGLEH